MPVVVDYGEEIEELEMNFDSLQIDDNLPPSSHVSARFGGIDHL